jgi:hypothetical protein
VHDGVAGILRDLRWRGGFGLSPDIPQRKPDILPYFHHEGILSNFCEQQELKPGHVLSSEYMKVRLSACDLAHNAPSLTKPEF